MFRPTAPASVLHRARPPRMPRLPSPFAPRAPKPTEGASVPRPAALVGPSTSSVPAKAALDSGGLTLHYAPPASAPSYTAGLPTAFTHWVAGRQVALTGEEAAPLLHAEAAARKTRPDWDAATLDRIRGMRAQGLSKGDIAKA